MRLLLLLSLCLLPFISQAEVIVFETFQDFVDQKGTTYDDYHGYSHAMGAVKIILKDNGKKVKIKCRDIWGFVYNDALFRTDHVHDQPVRLLSFGKICYYENGIAHLNMLKNDSESGSFSIGYYCYVSATIDGTLVPMPSTLLSDARKKIKKFKEANPQYKDLFDCIEKNYNYQNVRPCVEEFEKEAEDTDD